MTQAALRLTPPEGGPGLRVVAGSPARRLAVRGVAQGTAPDAARGLSRDELVARYVNLVRYVVARLGVSVPGLFDREDAMQAGVLGLMCASDGYKPEAGASFVSYAILRIRGTIIDAVRSLDPVSRTDRASARAIQGAIRDLEIRFGRSPIETEIAARLDMPVVRYRERLRFASAVTISLDEACIRDSDDDSVMLADRVTDPNAIDPAEEAARRDVIDSLTQKINLLGQRPRQILALRYRDEMAFNGIGRVLGLTESRVCQIHAAAIVTLRRRLTDPDVVIDLACVARPRRRAAATCGGAIRLQRIAVGG